MPPTSACRRSVCAPSVRRRDPPLQPQPAGRCCAVRSRAGAGGSRNGEPLLRVNSALISRSRVVELHGLSDEEIVSLVERALADERGLGGRYRLDAKARDAICCWRAATGARRSPRWSLPLVWCSPAPRRSPRRSPRTTCARPRRIARCPTTRTRTCTTTSSRRSSRPARGPPCRAVRSPRGWGRRPEVHRAPHVHRCVGGYRQRRSRALLIAEAVQVGGVIGYPECRINLAQAAIYLALAPKSNAAEAGIDAALNEVRNGPSRNVPDHLRDRHRPGSENYGEYKYPHSYPSGWVSQRYLPDGLERGCFYRSSDRGWEAYRSDTFARDRLDSGENPTSRGR